MTIISSSHANVNQMKSMINKESATSTQRSAACGNKTLTDIARESSSSKHPSSIPIARAAMTNGVPDSTSTRSSVAGENTTLPLGWTRVIRKQPTRTSANDEDPCCDDPKTCRQRRHQRPRLTRDASSPVVRGHAVFCLHEMEPSWIQGYFIPKGSRRPWGLLAVQEEIDDCLACQDGGFRRVTLTVYRPGTTKAIKIPNVDWTGGDMIRLSHTELEMEADRLWTGKSSLTFTDQYFKGLISKLRTQCEVADELPLLEWLPDVAVVVGSMALVLPHESEEASDDIDDF